MYNSVEEEGVDMIYRVFVDDRLVLETTSLEKAQEVAKEMQWDENDNAHDVMILDFKR